MNEERLVLEEGTLNCQHEWRESTKDWDETQTLKGETVIIATNHGVTRLCDKCGREELTGGTVICYRIPGYQMGGEYTLEPNGGLGLFIS